MTPLGAIFKNGRPKIDQHSLFTSIQISVPVLQGTLQVYEPWKRKGMKARPCHVTLYANDTSPFIVWYKVNNNMDGSPQTSNNSDFVQRKPRCVLNLNRAEITKTKGGCFEVVDFETKALFRFVAPSVRESEEWVEKLQGESVKEENLDIGSICSTCSSSSSASHPSPDSPIDFSSSFSTGFSHVTCMQDSPANRKHCRTNSYSDALSANMHIDNNNKPAMTRPSRLFIKEQTSNNYSHQEKTSPNGGPLRHTRAQPHLGVNIHIVDKSRPTLDNILNLQRQNSEPYSNRELLPLSEYFVKLPE